MDSRTVIDSVDWVLCCPAAAAEADLGFEPLAEEVVLRCWAKLNVGYHHQLGPGIMGWGAAYLT